MSSMKESLAGLYTSDNTLDQIRERLITSLDDPAKIRILIKDLYQQNQLASSQGFDSQAFHSVILGAAYFNLDEKKEAVKWLESASNQFRLQGEIWNQAIALRFLGLARSSTGNKHQAIEDFEKAISVLKQEKRIHKDEYEQKYEELINELDNLIKSPIVDASAKTAQIPVSKPSQKSTRAKRSWVQAHIAYGVNDFSHASREGKFILDDEQVSKMTVDEVKFDEVPYTVYNLRGGNQITYVSGGDYRWLKVAGESMNSAQPVPIEPDDFILAALTIVPLVGDIVIANLKNPPTPSERAGVVKRYGNDGLDSESVLPIDPIPFSDVEIRGVVLAVAKPSS